jgi:hypothetical protein
MSHSLIDMQSAYHTVRFGSARLKLLFDCRGRLSSGENFSIKALTQ